MVDPLAVSRPFDFTTLRWSSALHVNTHLVDTHFPSHLLLSIHEGPNSLESVNIPLYRRGHIVMVWLRHCLLACPGTPGVGSHHNVEQQGWAG